MITGVCMYLFVSILGISSINYFHVVTPSLSERTHPLKTALPINDTFIGKAFHNIYYNPYDLYI